MLTKSAIVIREGDASRPFLAHRLFTVSSLSGNIAQVWQARVCWQGRHQQLGSPREYDLRVKQLVVGAAITNNMDL